MKGIKVSMPFICINENHTEVTIESHNLSYGEIENLNGIQVDESKKEEAIKLCQKISILVKELHNLTK